MTANKRERRATDALAFAVVGLLLWLFGLLLGPVAVVRGVSARHRIDASGGEPRRLTDLNGAVNFVQWRPRP